MPQISGWLFDAYPGARGMILWIMDEQGRMHLCTRAYQPAFYLTGQAAELSRLVHWLERSRLPVGLSRVEKREFYSNDIVMALEVKVPNPLHYVPLVRRVLRSGYCLEPWTCDLPVPQLFFYTSGLFPTCRLTACLTPEGELVEYEVEDSPADTDYALPPLRILSIRPEGGKSNPAHGRSRPLLMEIEGEQTVWEESALVEELIRILRRYDPHLILTEWGDSFLLPRLQQLARRGGRALQFDREQEGCLVGLRGRSYFSYGKMFYVAPEINFRGRWHIDRTNSFVMHEAGLEGVMELARLAKIPVQRLARVSTGTCISAMQLEVVLRENYLIPYRKFQAEEFKTAEELLTIDKGGLTYQPVPGLHENVAELDFASMYPSIMTRYNLSPETLNCACCPEAPRVPETGYRVCQKRLGLIPKTLGMVLGKRVEYKRQKKTAATPELRQAADRRQSALKWMLVTCFGYLGYKNARFGKIEAHESTTALGREMLLRAKELVESRGFRLIHALTDSLWVIRPGTSRPEYEALAEAISRELDLSISLEGIFRWLNFVPSRRNPDKPVPNRYFGVYESGEFKLRGIEVRRSDSPRWVQRIQAEMLALWKGCQTLQECDVQIPAMLDRLLAAVDELKSGQVPFEELVLNRRISRDPASYEKASAEAIASQQLLGRGARLQPGERVQLVYLAAHSRIPSEKVRAYTLLDGACCYDVEKYTELLCKAAESLLIHFGWDNARLQEFVRSSPVGSPGGIPTIPPEKPCLRYRPAASSTLPLWA
jgi:DNA polymerase II